MKRFTFSTLSVLILFIGTATRAQDAAAPPADSTAAQPKPQLPGDGESEFSASGGLQDLVGQPLSDPFDATGRDARAETKTSSTNYTTSTNIILVVSEKGDAVSGLSKSTGKWAKQEIRPAATGVRRPTIGKNVAAIRIGQTIYAFSGKLASWDTLRLPADKKSVWSVQTNIVVARAGKTVYTFANATGKWTSSDADNTNATAAPQPTRKNVREVVESYIAAVMANKIADAQKLAVEGKAPATKKMIEELRQVFLDVKRRGVKRVFIIDVQTGNKDSVALAVSSPVIIPFPIPDGQNRGKLVFSVRQTNGKWLIDDIDYRTDEDALAQIAKFKQTHADAKTASRIAIILRMGKGTERATLAATVRNLKEIKLRSPMRPVVEIVVDNYLPKDAVTANIKAPRNTPYEDIRRIIEGLKSNGVYACSLSGGGIEDGIAVPMSHAADDHDHAHAEAAAGPPKPRSQQTKELAERYRLPNSKKRLNRKERSEFKRQLRNQVAAEFQARQEHQRAELSKLQRRLRKIQQLIETRVRMKEEIIDHRVEELLNPSLRWDAKTAPDVRAGITFPGPHRVPAWGSPQQSSPSVPATDDIIGREPGESIYNDRLKRFNFRLEKIKVVGVETAKAFLVKYYNGENRKIVGVWADPPTNSLIVTGPPETEQPIRDTLAQWEAESEGIETVQDNSLEVQQKFLIRQRNELLAEIASLQLAVIDIEAAGAKSGDNKKKLDLLNDQYQSFEKELKAVVLKLEVIRNTIYQQKQGEYLDTDIGEDADKAIQAQLALARERLKVVNAEYRTGKATVAELFVPMKDLAKLEVEAARTPQARLVARQQQIVMLQDIKKMMIARYKAGKTKQSDVLVVEAELLKAKAALDREFLPPLEKTEKQPPAALEGDPKGVHAASIVRDALGIDVNAVPGNRMRSTPYRGGLEIITILKGSRAMKAGMRLGDILVGLHVWEVPSIDNLVWVLQQPQVRPSGDQFKPPKFYLVRGKETLFGTILLPAEKKANGKEGGGEAAGDKAGKPPRLTVKATTGFRNISRPAVP